ncbi:MAG: beta-ketoacyl-[acyl-carrier-protein] synthase family protein [Verrucomicrobiales bacterium]|nr:beta-ketoacyl-[acyl-carrier-protein] synthase family protein [Verrucomicrobiales bacterium]
MAPSEILPRTRREPQRVVVTGIGLVTPLGHDHQVVFERLCQGESAIAPIRSFDVSTLPLKHAAVLPALDAAAFGISERERHILDSVQESALIAAEIAVRDSGLDLPRQAIRGNHQPSPGKPRMGTAIGMSHAAYEPIRTALEKLGSGRIRQVSPHALNQSRPCGCAALVSIRYRLQGPMLSQNAASATGALNVISAYEAIRSGRADVMIAGGADSGVNPLCLAIFSQNLTGSRVGRCRPFDGERDGVVLGEGAALVVMESREHALARGARIHGEMIGYGQRSDAHDMSVIPAEATGLTLSIEEALRDAGLESGEVGYINAHGTATLRNDIGEATAIRRFFPDPARAPWVSGTKGQLGHMLAASGSAEFVVALLASRDDRVPPTAGLENPDPNCELRHVMGKAIRTPVPYALSLSIGMGGMNSAIVVRGEKGPAAPKAG